jgi:hypothetical protein
MRPTYASMYPPAQGLVMAAGKLLAGREFWGVLFTIGTMCAALCWAFQGWLPLEWALLGGFLAVIRLAAFSYWSNTYWGAPVAVTAGALVFGALPRIVGWTPPRRATPPRTNLILTALLLGFGLIILANIRPYEGLIFSVPVGIVLLTWLVTKIKSGASTSDRAAAAKVLVPLALALFLGGTLMCFYFWRVTGSPFKMPQLINRDTYAEAPYFIWQHPHHVEPYRHPIFRQLYIDFEMVDYNQTHSARTLFALWNIRAASLWSFFLGPVLTLPILLLLLISPQRRPLSQLDPQARFLVLASLFCFIGLYVEVFLAPHYAAPMTALVLLLVLLALRKVRSWRLNSAPTGIFVTRAVPVICCLMLLIRICAGQDRLHLEGSLWSWGNAFAAPSSERTQLQAKLAANPGKQLVLVNIDMAHARKLDLNWVYNDADIAASKVIWAWDMGNEANQKLIEAYPGRTVWLLQPDLDNPQQQLTPYLVTADSADSATANSGTSTSTSNR